MITMCLPHATIKTSETDVHNYILRQEVRCDKGVVECKTSYSDYL